MNMKPKEILGLIEEAAGTRMFENKKLTSLKVMERKQAKVDEINSILAKDITPSLEKFRAEKSDYLKWTACKTEVERMQRFVTHTYTCNIPTCTHIPLAHLNMCAAVCCMCCICFVCADLCAAVCAVPRASVSPASSSCRRGTPC